MASKDAPNGPGRLGSPRQRRSAYENLLEQTNERSWNGTPFTMDDCDRLSFALSHMNTDELIEYLADLDAAIQRLGTLDSIPTMMRTMRHSVGAIEPAIFGGHSDVLLDSLLQYSNARANMMSCRYLIYAELASRRGTNGKL